MRDRTRVQVALILSPFVFSFAFALDSYVPLIPQMKQVFHASQFLMQMTLSLFFCGVALGEVIIGPLSDQFGRYKVIIVSIFIYIFGSIICAFALTISMFILGRVICAIGASGMLVVSFAIVRDLFSGDESAQLYSWLNAGIGISPTFAPIIGGYIAFFLGWHAVFWFLAIMGTLMLFLTHVFVKETLEKRQRKKINRRVFVRYALIFSNRSFLRYTLLGSLGVTICFSFFSVSSFILINLIGVKEEYFGYYFIAFGIVLIFAGLLAGKIVLSKGLENTIKWGTALIFLGGGLMLISNVLFGLYAISFMVFSCISVAGAVFCIGAAAAGAMESFPEIAGTAAASLQAAQFLISAIITSVLMLFPTRSSIPFSICILLVASAGVLVQFIKVVPDSSKTINHR